MSIDEMLALADYLDDLESKMLAADADMLIDEETAPSIWAYRIRSRLSASLLDGLGQTKSADCGHKPEQSAQGLSRATGGDA